ncbi:MAG TPA: magnesium transporter CorA family protein [Gemmatimonadales bacterium]|nr:magnesium transporter CorA family protein [Gemmatimonadales bacterium]
MRLVVDAPDAAAPAEVDVERLSELLADTRNRLWLDIGDPGPDEVALLRRVFGFHEIALEEVTKPHERPHCEAYGRYYFVVVYAAEAAGDSFVARELNLFWSENYLVTIHRRTPAALAVLAEARRRWERHEGRTAYGVAALAYALFESLVEGYFVVQDRMRERIERIEEEIFKGADRAAADLFRLRKELLRVPRLLAPTSHVLGEVLRREHGVPEGLRPYFGDVQDHAVHVLAELDTYRDLLGAALDVQVFYAFNRLGRIMQRLTAITVIILVPNFVASIFGMNFGHIPFTQSELGFVLVVAFLGVMVAWGFIHSRILGWL